ncbi:MAG: DUF3179 domain-containing (seleno)protein [Psychromonas sp.]
MKINKKLSLKIIFWLTMGTAQIIAFILFKELADLSQWVIQGAREGTMAIWYNRIPLAITSVIALAIASAIWLKTKAGVGKKGFIALLVLFAINWFSGIINPHLMMRPRQDNAVFINIEQAQKYITPEESVIVYEIDGKARAHADKQVLRPHVAGGEPVNGTEVVMTYCGLTNLGMAFIPEIDGQAVDMAPMTQLENNLVLFDKNTNEPIQQLWGQTEADVIANIDRGMKEYPTFRMPFATFSQAYPDGEVFINDYLVEDMRTSFWSNPVVFVYDRAMELIFETAIHFQETEEAPVFPTIEHFDDRLTNKELIWGFDINDDYVSYTEEFVKENGHLINVTVGGQDIVISYDEQYQSLGIFYNNTSSNINSIDFFGMTDIGIKLQRVETVKAGIYWVVWANFFPETDLNRI